MRATDNPIHKLGVLCVSAAFWAILIFTGCENPARDRSDSRFSQADSLTEIYLALRDTMLQVWNTMIHDDNGKIKAMHRLATELRMESSDHAELENFESRLEELKELRYDQESMSDPERVSQYDFASNSLVSELIAMAESHPDFTTNVTLQTLVDSIRSADQRVMNYRAEYDDIAGRFNRFLEKHYESLDDVYIDTFPQKKPLFQMAAE